MDLGFLFPPPSDLLVNVVTGAERLWLTVLNVVLQEMRRNSLIKDSMREQCIPHLVESWFQILQAYQRSHPELTCQCLEVVGLFVSWIDLNLIANDRSVASLTNTGHML